MVPNLSLSVYFGLFTIITEVLAVLTNLNIVIYNLTVPVIIGINMFHFGLYDSMY